MVSSIALALLLTIVSILPLTYWVIVMRSFTLIQEKPAVLDVHQLKFNSYIINFNKSYDSDEYERRFQNFKASLIEIARLNAIEGNSVFGLTKFADMSKKEFADRILTKPGTISSCTPNEKTCMQAQGNATAYDQGDVLCNKDSSTNGIAKSCDWRDHGVIGEVLNQKQCLACWAFSVVGVMESMAAIRKIDKLESRSIQELIDCSDFTNGCLGGHVSRILDFLCRPIGNPLPVVKEEEYPLTLSDDRRCKMKNIPNPSGVRIKNFKISCYVNEELMVRKIATHGPIIAVVDATNWMYYLGGIIRWACGENNPNHVIQIVGYNINEATDSEHLPHYLIRNSYGEDFGENGYVKVAYNENVCGVSELVTWIDVA